MKQTAVEWYDAQLKEINFKLQSGLINFEQCKVLMSEAFEKAFMVKEYLYNFYMQGKVDIITVEERNVEQYYNETFKLE